MRRGIVQWDDVTREIYGHEGSGELTLEEAEERLHPEDRERAARALNAALHPAGSGRYHLVVRVLRGEDVRWVRVIGQAERRQEGGQPTRLVGFVEELHATTGTAGVRDIERAVLQRMAEHSPAVMAIYSGPDHTVTMVNPAWERFVRKADVLGRPFREVFPEVEETDLPEILDRVYDTGQPHVAHETVFPLRRHGDVTTLYWNFVWEPLRDAQGRVTDVFLHAVEVTEQVEARRELERLRVELERDLAQLEAVVDRMDEGLIVADMDGRMFRWNARALEIHGFQDRIEGQRSLQEFEHVFELKELDGRAIPIPQWPIARALAGESFSGWDLIVERKRDLHTRTFRYGGAPVTDSSGTQILALVTVRDVTEQVEQQEQLAEAKRLAEEANRAKSDFLANMSHELRTPLNAIAGYTDLLDAEIYGTITEGQRQALHRIDLSQRILLRLINDMINLGRIESGQLEVRPELVWVIDLIRDIEPVMLPLVEKKHLTYEIGTCDELIQVLADPDRTRQILLNLLANAVKFTPIGGGIMLSWEEAAEGVAIHVGDTGPGIAPHEQERIFEPFVQLSGSPDQAGSGAGLGLSISRHLARAMGGDIMVSSPEGAGATFTLRLPKPV